MEGGSVPVGLVVENPDFVIYHRQDKLIASWLKPASRPDLTPANVTRYNPLTVPVQMVVMELDVQVDSAVQTLVYLQN
ncbi:hypothetical protein V6N11_028231 [Hibiscus sabdariffa]|uniref:Uncharacterized protein n=1 Tax=Hibiscus sabdariffa TaxID=183260 RepID=A0ABR2N8D5_9ROSI